MCIKVWDTPCNKCHKSLSSRKMLRQHEQACKEGKRHDCDVCHKSYASQSILKQHKKVSHAPEHDEVYCCPHCDKEYWVRKGACKSIQESVSRIQTGRDPTFVGWKDAPGLSIHFKR